MHMFPLYVLVNFTMYYLRQPCMRFPFNISDCYFPFRLQVVMEQLAGFLELFLI